MLLILAAACATDCAYDKPPDWDGTTEQCAAVVACVDPVADWIAGGNVSSAEWFDGTELCGNVEECDALRDGLVWFACDKFVPDAP